MAGFTKTLIVDGNTLSSADYHTIAAAVGSAQIQNNGGTIIVEEFDSTGTGYDITTALDLPSNITIIGRGNVLLTVSQNIRAFTASSKSRVVISGFRINASCSSYSSQLIYFLSTNNCIVENCTLSVASPTTDSVGICMEGTSTSFAEGNVISGCTISGVGTNAGPYAGILLGQYCKRNMISGNTVHHCNDNCMIREYSEHNIVMGNVFRNSNSGGSYGGLYLCESKYNAIVGNECTENANNGIYLRSSSLCTVQGNVCKGTSGTSAPGICLRGDNSNSLSQYNTVTGNVCESNSGSGILISAYASYNAVDGNTSAQNVNGILENTTNANYNLIVGNVSKNNSSMQIGTYGANTIVAGNVQ